MIDSVTRRKTGITNKYVSYGESHRRERSFATTISVRDDELNENENDDDDDDEGDAALLENTENYLALRYQNMVDSGDISFDDHQMKAVQELDRLRRDLLARPKNTMNDDRDEEKHNDDGFLSNLFRSVTSSAHEKVRKIVVPRSPPGVYVHGGVGCGKTFCMDLFYESIPSSVVSKQKVHFHKFMLGVHATMHRAKMIEKNVEGDVLPEVVRSTLKNGRLLCFDEFQVTDVADALVLRRLFTGLWERGAVIVATSNRPPRDLYLNGLQRDLFLPFIASLEDPKRNAVVDMWGDDATDYRAQRETADDAYFFGPTSGLDFNRAFHRATRGRASSLGAVDVPTAGGRVVPVPRSTPVDDGTPRRDRVARLAFDDLCRRPLGADDYLAIGETYGTVFLEGVPRLSFSEINVVRRLIVLVDALYECRVRLVVRAEAGPNELYEVDLDDVGTDESFAFDRTRSRLEEMSSATYLREINY